MNVPLDYVLLGSGLLADAAALWLLAAVILLFLSLGFTCRASLHASPGARLAFVAAGGAALLQSLAGELLLFMAAGAIFGYALLAFGLAGRRLLARGQALTSIVLLVTGDLALLELAMLLASGQLHFAGAAAALSPLRGDLLVEFCLVLGFGCRIALALMHAATAPAGARALLPGWLALALCAMAGALRLSCGGALATQCAAPISGVFLWVPVLAALALLLPRIVPPVLRSLITIGNLVGRLRDAGSRFLGEYIGSIVKLLGAALNTESQLIRWRVAMAVGAVLAAAIAAVLVLATPA